MVLLLTNRQMEAHVGQGAFAVCLVVSTSQQEFMEDVLVRPNVRAKRATAAGRQARAGENVPRTTGPGLVACRWCSA